MDTMPRKFGIEMEGYTAENPESYRLSIPNADVKRDGSLRNSDWSSRSPYYGVEVNVKATRQIKEVEEAFDEMVKRGWAIHDSKPGTHIHVDVSDYEAKDIAKLLMFGKYIEPVMFMLVRDARYSNQYCTELTNGWKEKEVWDEFNRIDWDEEEKEKAGKNGGQKAGYRLVYILHDLDLWGQSGGSPGYLYNKKYSWINVLTNFTTIEFRLFHAISYLEDAKSFIRLAVSIVEIVKNSTVEQLKFTAKTILEQDSPEGMVEKLCEALDVPPMQIYGDQAKREVEHMKLIGSQKLQVV